LNLRPCYLGVERFQFFWYFALCMSPDHQTNKDQAASRQRDDVMRILRTMADTTWRMFVPPAVVVPMGIWADLKWGTKPWLTILAAMVGLVLSVAMVAKQMREGA
jgi:F0F1-type ATP synthase assembly protein I